MFPDLNSEWIGYPSQIDGISFPYVSIVGVTLGKIHLLVSGDNTSVNAYRISGVPLLYWVVDEFELSVAAHGLTSLAYDGTTYIKQARQSSLLAAYGQEPICSHYPSVQHFAFLGSNECVELVTDRSLEIAALSSKEDRDTWLTEICGSIREGHLGH